MKDVVGERTALEVERLTKAYVGSVTVGPISFSVREGEFFSLLGPSGCGKSTTLRCIAGFESVTSGKILLGGSRLDTVPAHRRELGMVFQSHALFPHLSIAENVAFGLRLRKLPEPQVRERVDWALGLVGLGGLGHRAPSQISGGQQQRVALARSLILKPPLLLLDEPLSSLDLKLRHQMREELRNLQRQLGQTTIFVTHDQTEALAMSDRLAVMSEGRIEQIGTPEEIYRRPATAFVASFIGQANLIEAKVDAVGDGLVHILTPDGGRLAPRPAEPARWSVGSLVLAVLRPEDLALGEATSSGVTPLSGRIADVEYLGEDTLLRVDAAGFPRLLASFKTTRAATARLGEDAVRLSVEPEDVFLIER